MEPIEFQTELDGGASLQLPPEVVALLPKTGTATVVVHIQSSGEDADWKRAAYEQFMKDDSAEDAIYDCYE